jgi:metal-responsive CopG/Arc/MetJ family transcriptional regulator
MLKHMKQILVEIDDQTAAELERVAPARSRKRSEFIRHALRRALWDEEERKTRDAYLSTPDSTEVYIEPTTWEPTSKKKRKR